MTDPKNTPNGSPEASASPTLARIQEEHPFRNASPMCAMGYYDALESAIPALDAENARLWEQLAEADVALIVYRKQSLLGCPESEKHYEAYKAALDRQEQRRKETK